MMGKGRLRCVHKLGLLKEMCLVARSPPKEMLGHVIIGKGH